MDEAVDVWGLKVTLSSGEFKNVLTNSDYLSYKRKLECLALIL